MKKLYSIGETAQILGVSIDTLRRWGKRGYIQSVRLTQHGHRHYTLNEINSILSRLSNKAPDIMNLALQWVTNKESIELEPSYLYCADSSVFHARLTKLENKIKSTPGLEVEYPLITSVVGEIGNNSFDHNIGAWPNTRGIFFGYDLSQKNIVLADRGQGVLTTLRSVRPALKNDAEALYVAFTETISARENQKRGNGLKYVIAVITKFAKEIEIKLTFTTGNATLEFSKRDKELKDKISLSDNNIHGCLVLIKF